MKKIKYRFDADTLQYVTVKTKYWVKLARVFGFISAACVFGLIFILLAYQFIDSPKETVLRQEINDYKLQTKLLEDKVKKIEGVMKGLEYRDEKIYREVFGAAPISDEVRNAGIGGIDRYQALKSYKNADQLISLHQSLDLISRKVYVQSKSYDELTKLAKEKNIMLQSVPAIQPVANKDLRRVASGFGYRIDPVYRTTKFHEGMDFTAPIGTEIFATGDGVIELTEVKEWGYGRSIIINHNYGYKTRYAHMSRFIVKQGQKVKRGQLIGYVGSTGKSTGPHLHYEVLKNDKAVNPANYYYNDLSPEQYEDILKLSNTANQSFD